MRRFRTAAFLLVLAAGAAAEEPLSRPEQVALFVLEAASTGDDEALGLLACDRSADAYLVVDALLGRHAEAVLADAPDARVSEAARLYAAACATRADAEGLAEWVARWRGWSRDDLARETRLRGLRAQARRAFDADDAARMAALAREGAADVAALPASLAAAELERIGGIGFAYVSRYDEALQLLAERPASAPRWPVGEVARLVWVVYALSEGPDPARALAPAARGRDLAMRLGGARAATFSERRARALHLLGRFEESLAEADAGASVALARGEHVTASSAFTAAAASLMKLDRATEAIDRASRARTAAEAGGIAQQITDTYVVEGAARAAAGQLARGLELAERGLAGHRERGAPYQIAAALYTVAALCMQAGLLERAEAFYREGVTHARAGGDPRTEGRLRKGIGQVALEQGRLEEAEQELLAARELLLRCGDVRDLQWTLNSLGLVHARRHPGEEGLRLLEQAVTQAEARGDTRPLAHALNALGNEEMRRGRLEDAQRHAQQALALAGSAPGRASWLAGTLQLLALLEHGAGRAPESLARLLEVTELRAAGAQGLGAEEASGIRGRVRDASDSGFAIALGQADDVRTAFAFAEVGRSGVLLRDVLQRDQILAARLAPDVAVDERRTRERVAQARARLSQAVHATPRDPLAANAAQGELRTAAAEREQVLNRVERGARLDLELATPQRADLAEFQAALPAKTAFVLYQGLETKFHALVVTAQGVRAYDLGERAALERDVAAWLDLAGAPGGPEEPLAAALHARLLAPLAAALAGSERLVIAPDGLLAFLPFGALLRVEGETRRRLVEDVEVVCVPSATLFLALLLHAPARGRGLVALGDPAYGAPPEAGMRGAPADAAEALPLSRAEVEEVAARFPPEERTLLLGADATGARLTQTLRDAAPRVRAVHLACHAVIDPAHPRLSGLVLAGGETFSLFDVATQRVDADLVTLSACGTARGRLIRGEGPLGLVYGFFLAGASRVLATAWHVEDASTRALLVRVYDGWLKDGLSVAAALRRAQREQIAAGGPLAHPYHWAAFTLWGLP